MGLPEDHEYTLKYLQAPGISLTVGLEKLFSFCKTVKVDVANHQIQSFSSRLTGDDGVPFQQDYFLTASALRLARPGMY